MNTPNATVNNEATVKGDIIINGVAKTTWNEDADGNTLVVNDETATININSNTESVIVTKASNVIIAESASVTTFTANGGVNVEGADKIQNAVIEAVGVALDKEPESITTTENVTIGGVEKTAEEFAKGAFYSTAQESYEIKVNETLVANVGFDKSTNVLTVTFKDNKIDNVLSAAGQFFTEILQGELGVKGVILPAVEGNSSYPEKSYTLDEDQIGPMALHALALIGGTTEDFNGGFDFTAKIQLEGYVEYVDNFKVTFNNETVVEGDSGDSGDSGGGTGGGGGSGGGGGQ